MIDRSSNIAEKTPGRRSVVAWLLFPLALFPLAALLTYDWRSIPALCIPPRPHTNWIGALGDGFAYYGYSLFGIAVWTIPALCIISGLCAALGRNARILRRLPWFMLFLFATSGLLQVLGGHGGPIAAFAASVNTPNPGGAIGYLVMTRALSPLISDFGSSVVMAIVMLFALIAAVGLHDMAAFLRALANWACARTADRAAYGATGADGDDDGSAEQEQYLAALRAKEEARRQKEEEKARIKAEKIAAKEAARAAKEAAKEAARAEKEAARQVKSEAGGAAPAPAVQEAAAPDDKGPYVLPSTNLLKPLSKSKADHGDVGEMTKKLIDTLKIFNIDAELAYTVQGPVVTKYALRLAPGIRYSAVKNISDNLMGALHAVSLRIEAPIPGEECVGIEVPNRAPAGITFREIVESDAWRNFKGELPLLFGKDAAGKELIADLASMPHMLVAGATGQGKSVCLNAIINGLLMRKTPEELKLIMVDPKSVEFTAYAALPHLIVPVITDNMKVVFSLQWAVVEMEKRLKMFARAKVKNIYDFNHRPSFTQTDMFGEDTAVGSDMPKTVPYVVIIIDEVADLMAAAAKQVVPNISRLTAKARAAGIHLILATQRPDAKVITGTIKANIPGRVAFKTATSIDSRTILDDIGAENLIGRGDMLFKSKEGLLIRAQGAWIRDDEVAAVTHFIEEHSATQFDDRFTKKLSTLKEEEVDLYGEGGGNDDEARAAAQEAKEQVKAENNASDFKKAVECIINTQRASTSHFQRKLGWGYNHSAKIMDMLEDAGIIGPQIGAGPRQIIMDQEQLLAVFNSNSGAGDAGQDTQEEDGQ
jgi:S-DNA-T family DNA segregation ATPase FtsK/SpoIIIE